MRDYEFYYTKDGSIGLYSHSEQDVYHSKFGAVTEAWEKFVLPSNISKIMNNQSEVKVLDVCYGIGYNTKALMSYIINENYDKLIYDSLLKKFLKKIILILKKLNKIFLKIKKVFHKYNTETIDNNNTDFINKELSSSIETINNDVVSNFTIDCLDINEELVKISPLLKTFITPQEIFLRIVPRIFDCFDTYWKIRKYLSKLASKFTPKNKKYITELLDLKFNNDYENFNEEYRLHEFVNYILIDSLIKQYGEDYINLKMQKLIKEKNIKNFIKRDNLKYALFRQDFRYNLLSRLDLCGNLHNIYYDHLSKRYKKAKFKTAEALFNLSFYVNDARKSILSLNKQYDLIFMDAFTFSKSPELWTLEFIAELYKRLSPNGLILTYSNSALVRNTFLENNFYVGKIIDNKTGKFIGTVAAKEKSLIEYPLSNYELGLCNTKAGIPYRDPLLNYSKEEILKHRELEFKESDLMTSSQYLRTREVKNGGV